MDELQITAPDDLDGADLISLREWLTDSPETRGLRVALRQREPDPAAMPGVELVDAVVSVVTDRAVLAALSSGVAGWLTARLSTRRTRLRMRLGDREIEVDTASVRDLDELAEWIQRHLAGEEPPPDDAHG